MSNPLRFAEAAVGVVLGRDQISRRSLDEMTTAELEARAQVNEERLRLARKAGWISGFGGGFMGTLGVVKLLKSK